MMDKNVETNSIHISPYNYRAIGISENEMTTVVRSNKTNFNKSALDTKIFFHDINIFLQSISKYRMILWYMTCGIIAFMLCMWILFNINSNFSFPIIQDITNKLYTPPSITSVQGDIIVEKRVVKSSLFSHIEVQKYELQSGDILMRIANKFNRRIDTLVSWNEITDARRIRAGDEIFIPNQDGVLHTVKNGDSIDTLANLYNVKSVSILDINNLKSNKIVTGTKLFIPGARMSEFELGLVLGTVFLAPTRGTISSYYGYRISPVTGIRSFHGGIDVANNIGTSINVASYGTVSYVAYNNPVYGNMVLIRHLGGFQTLYGHLDRIYVKKGQRVGRGSQLGTMGNSGLSTGAHLHFTIILNGKTINPLKYVRFR